LKSTRWLPFLAWWPGLTRETWRADILAALSGAIVVLPQAVAFATIAGLPPQYGFYCAMLPAVVAGLWGSSRHLVSGPTTAISVLVAATLGPLAAQGSAAYVSMAIALAFMAGLMQLAMGLARLGALVNFISHTVIVGFTAGAAVLIIVSQLGNFVGLELPRGAGWMRSIELGLGQLGLPHLLAATVGLATMGSGLLARRLWPRVPYMIVAMVVGSGVAALLKAVAGANAGSIRTVGALPGVVPPLSLPDLSPTTVQSLLFPAAVVAVIGLTEAVAIARAVAVKSGQRLDADQEFIGQGLSNLIGSFTSAYPSSGSFNRSGINFEAGARSPMAAVLSAPILLAIALLAAPLAAWLPVPAMAAILFIVGWGLIDRVAIAQIIRRHPRERLVLLVTWAGVLVDLEKGLFIGIVVSLLFYLYRTSQPRIEERAPPPSEFGNPRRKMVLAGGDAPVCPQLAMLRLNGSIYFGAVEHVREHFQRLDEVDPRRKWLMLVASGVNFVDYAGAHLLAEESVRRRAMGGGLVIVGPGPAASEMLERSGCLDEIGRDLVYLHKGDAIRAVYPRLDPAICACCPLQVFEECRLALPDGSARNP
jgi:SulP family sulfate permease